MTKSSISYQYRSPLDRILHRQFKIRKTPSTGRAAFTRRTPVLTDSQMKKKVNATYKQVKAILSLQGYLAALKNPLASFLQSPNTFLFADERTTNAVAMVSAIPDYKIHTITVRDLLMQIKTTAGASLGMKEAINKALNLTE